MDLKFQYNFDVLMQVNLPKSELIEPTVQTFS